MYYVYIVTCRYGLVTRYQVVHVSILTYKHERMSHIGASSIYFSIIAFHTQVIIVRFT